MCSVCTETYNKSTRQPIKCMYCEYVACTSCYQKYMIESTTNYRCMKFECKKEMTPYFIRCNFTGVFNDQLKEVKKKEIFDQEQLILPETQHIINREIFEAELTDQMNTIKTQINKCKSEIYDHIRRTNNNPLCNPTEKKENTAKLKVLRRSQQDLKQQLYTLALNRHRYRIHNDNDNDNDNDHDHDNDNEDDNEDDNDNDNGSQLFKRRKFIRHCSNNECRGFLSSQWKCGLCMEWTCSKCYTFIGENATENEHVCDPANIESAKLIASDTKSCPKCAVRIFKIIGCDHMWCTQCHVSFSWKTGQVMKTTSNPHYYEWLIASNKPVPREIGDNGGRVDNCDVLMFEDVLDDVLGRRHGYNIIPIYAYANMFEITKIINNIIIGINIRHLYVHLDASFPRNLNHFKNNSRVKYLKKQCTKEQYMSRIYSLYTTEQCNSEYYSICMLLFTVCNDITRKVNQLLTIFEETDNTLFMELNSLHDSLHDSCIKQNNQLLEYYKEYTELFKYCTNLFIDVSTTYNKLPIYISEYGQITRNITESSTNLHGGDDRNLKKRYMMSVSEKKDTLVSVFGIRS